MPVAPKRTTFTRPSPISLEGAYHRECGDHRLHERHCVSSKVELPGSVLICYVQYALFGRAVNQVSCRPDMHKKRNDRHPCFRRADKRKSHNDHRQCSCRWRIYKSRSDHHLPYGRRGTHNSRSAVRQTYSRSWLECCRADPVQEIASRFGHAVQGLAPGTPVFMLSTLSTNRTRSS